MLNVRSVASVGMLVTMIGAAGVSALPTLQLDVSGGIYDEATETIMATGDFFTVYALLNSSRPEAIAATYDLSIALMPSISQPQDLGFFSINGNQIQATGDMAYGTPSTNIGNDIFILPSHSIFPTFYLDQEFTFVVDQKAAAYNTADNPGGFVADAGGSLFYQAFTFDISNLNPECGLHFDLFGDYTTEETRGKKTVTVYHSEFAPFSHDAGTTQVPEPATITLLGLGLLGMGFLRRKVK